MKYNVVTECTCCNDKTLCREDVVEVDGSQSVLHFCEFCDKEIQDILDCYNQEQLKKESDSMLKMEDLEKFFKLAKKEKVEFVGILVSMDGYERPEVIINGYENFDKKLEYYKGAYNEDLTLKAAPDKVRIVRIAIGDSFEEIEGRLFE